MANEYGKRNGSRQRNRGGFSKQFLSALVCFLFGYLSASVFDFTSLSSWVNNHFMQKIPLASIKTVPQQAELPKPKFEFYTLLASEHHDAGEQAATTAAAASPPVSSVVPTLTAEAKVAPVTVASSKPSNATVPEKPLIEPVAVGKDAYVVQVAAFRSRPVAERMKAALVLKGFMVTISLVNQQSTSWYRVNLGPFASKTTAQQAQSDVAHSEHIVGMIRKMDA